jgi:hypothetical protein
MALGIQGDYVDRGHIPRYPIEGRGIPPWASHERGPSHSTQGQLNAQRTVEGDRERLRPEPDQASIEKVVGQAMERYLRNDSERKEPSPQVERRTNSETQQVDIGAHPLAETGPVTVEEKIPEIDMNEKLVEVDPLSSTEVSQETSASMIEVTPELHESYELPVKDLELLLVELDANPFEVQPEKNIEADRGPE